MSGFKGVLTSSPDNEIGLITFTVDNLIFGNIQKYSLEKADKLIGIRSGKYGANIFITWTETKSLDFAQGPPQQFLTGDSSQEDQYSMLVDLNGNVINPKTKMSGNLSVSSSDDIRQLIDGTPIWGYVDINNKLKIYSLTTPPEKKLINSTPTDESKISFPSNIIPYDIFLNVQKKNESNYINSN